MMRSRIRTVTASLGTLALLLAAALFVPGNQLNAGGTGGGFGRLDAEHAEYYSDDSFTVQVGAELWGCGGGHIKTGQTTPYVKDYSWSCATNSMNHSLCFYGYVEWAYGPPLPNTGWMPYWIIAGYYDNCRI